MKDRVNKNKKIKKPWPTKDAMEQVYEMKLWGNNDSAFYSGIGSHHPDIIMPYIATVSSFLKSLESPITVCDLGCGDFNVGKELVGFTDKYIGVDIVAPLVKHNSEKFVQENLEFYCLDIAVDDLPRGDVVILRQVLQHLSNSEIQSVLKKLSAYKYLILTEHLPEGDFVPNKEIISGQGTRLKKQSGVDLTAPPFNFKIKEKKKLLSVLLDDRTGVIETSLYKIQ